MKLLKPPALKPGGRIALVSPASSFDQDRWHAGAAAMRAAGYEPVPMPNSMKRTPPYFAGTVEERLADLHQAFENPTIDAILANRGGYGSNMLLPGLDLELIRAYPKPFIGYSDITSLMSWMLQQTGLVTFHGPLLAGDFSREGGVERSSWDAALTGAAHWELGRNAGLTPLKQGTARGPLVGGCLPMLTASLGTAYEIETADSVLFLEDVNTRPYQIDRMLMQLKYAGKLDRVRGVVFGAMLDCVSPGAPPDLLWTVIARLFENFPGPVAYGLNSGHLRTPNFTLPLGVDVELEVQQRPVLRFLESAVREH